MRRVGANPALLEFKLFGLIPLPVMGIAVMVIWALHNAAAQRHSTFFSPSAG